MTQLSVIKMCACGLVHDITDLWLITDMALILHTCECGRIVGARTLMGVEVQNANAR